MVVGTFAIVTCLIIQTLSAQSIGYPGVIRNAAVAEAILGNGIIPFAPEPCIPEHATFNGGGFKVTSYSSVAPTGIAVQSDNLLVEGPLTVTGKMPFLGVVSVEGALPAVGEGAVSYGCGNGDVGIVSEGVEGLAGLAGYNGIPNGLVGRGPLYQ